MMSTCEVRRRSHGVGQRSVLERREQITIRTNGADSRKNSHSEVVATTRTPAMFSSAQTMTTASPTITPRCPSANHGNSRVR